MGLDGSINDKSNVTPHFVPEKAPMRVTVTGDSVLQFLSFAVSRAALNRVQCRFAEDGSGEDALLQSFAEDAIVPAHLLVHTFTVCGGAAADTFLGAWLPIPCLRHSTRPDLNPATQGPTNWVRFRLVPDGQDFRLVLAFDTWLADPAANIGNAGVSPTLDDARDGTTFRFASELEAIEHFISEPWIDDWITIQPTTTTSPPAARTLTRLAHYLTVLAALRSTGTLPDVEIASTASGRLSASLSMRSVDLAIAFGDDACHAHLIDVARFDVGDPTAVVPLGLRDLDRPWIAHRGRMPNAVAFSRVSFGNDALSRLSGRLDAFAWPSLVRVGRDAHELCLRQPTQALRSGLRSLLSSVCDSTPNDSVWRIAGDGNSAQARLPFVSGPLLALLTETGERVATGVGRTRATRARFAASSLVRLAIQEIVIQAIAAANQVDLNTAGTQRPPARLRTILVMLPDGKQDVEIDATHQLIRDGVALAFDALQWPSTTQPDVVFVPARVRATQYAYLHNEIAHRLAGRAPAYLRVLAGPMRPVSADVSIAALDLDAAGLALNISRVTSSDETHLALAPSIEDTAGIGLDHALACIGRRIIVPALVRHLETARLAQADAFMQRALLPQRTSDTGLNAFDDRIVHETILPAALGLLTLHHTSSTVGDRLTVDTTLGALLAGNVDHIGLQRLQDLAVAGGANATSLLDARVVATAADVHTIVVEVLGPAVRAACRTVRRNACSLLLLSGHPAVMGLLRDMALSEASVTPDRIVDLTTYRFGAWAGPPADLAAARASGSLLASRQTRHAAPRVATRFVAFDDTSPRGRTAAFSVDPKASGSNGSVVEHTHTLTFDGTPRVLGVSQIDTSQWPLRPLARLEVADADALRRVALPLTVTLVFKGSGAISIDAFEISSVRDARGRHLPPTILEMKTSTTRPLDVAVIDTSAANPHSGGLA